MMVQIKMLNNKLTKKVMQHILNMDLIINIIKTNLTLLFKITIVKEVESWLTGPPTKVLKN
jgi:hypothetical protein